MTTTSQRTASLPVLSDGCDERLHSDAAALQEALSNLLRVFQLRDRECICCHDISVSQCYALEALVAGGQLTLNQLAEALLLDKSTTSRIIQALEVKGYAERRPHPEDGRSVLLVATPSGSDLFQRIEADLVGEVEQVITGFAPDVRRAMTALLSGLGRAAVDRVQRGGGCCRWTA